LARKEAHPAAVIPVAANGICPSGPTETSLAVGAANIPREALLLDLLPRAVCDLIENLPRKFRQLSGRYARALLL
jgi:hypothetical protein